MLPNPRWVSNRMILSKLLKKFSIEKSLKRIFQKLYPNTNMRVPDRTNLEKETKEEEELARMRALEKDQH